MACHYGGQMPRCFLQFYLVCFFLCIILSVIFFGVSAVNRAYIVTGIVFAGMAVVVMAAIVIHRLCVRGGGDGDCTSECSNCCEQCSCCFCGEQCCYRWCSMCWRGGHDGTTGSGTRALTHVAAARIYADRRRRLHNLNTELVAVQEEIIKLSNRCGDHVEILDELVHIQHDQLRLCDVIADQQFPSDRDVRIIRDDVDVLKRRLRRIKNNIRQFTRYQQLQQSQWFNGGYEVQPEARSVNHSYSSEPTIPWAELVSTGNNRPASSSTLSHQVASEASITCPPPYCETDPNPTTPTRVYSLQFPPDSPEFYDMSRSSSAAPLWEGSGENSNCSYENRGSVHLEGRLTPSGLMVLQSVPPPAMLAGPSYADPRLDERGAPPSYEEASSTAV